MLLWGLCLVFCCWSLAYLADERQAERERALYGGWSVHEWIDQALGESYYSCRWTTHGDPEEGKFDKDVIAIGAPAVPELVARLRGLRTGRFHMSLIKLHRKLMPRARSRPSYFELPRDISGDAAHINYLLSNMGVAARPAVPAMLDSAGEIHAWAYYDLLADLVRMGHVGRDVLQQLHQWAQAGHKDAALAVRFIEAGVTEFSDYYLEQMTGLDEEKRPQAETAVQRKAEITKAEMLK
jgi:hypothetical protein